MLASLAIGDFAKATQLSIKTLRHYHELGLLVPAVIDADTGYRRYTTDQLPAAQVIRRLRDLDMPLVEIAAVLRTAEPSARGALIAAHLERLEGMLAKTQAAVASLRELLAGPTPTDAVSYRSEPVLHVAAITAIVEADELSAWFRAAIDELDATLAAQRIVGAGPSGAIVADDLFTAGGGELTVFVPAIGVRPHARVAPLTVPAVELAVIVHHGAHADIDRSYGSLARFVTERAVGVEGKIRERYLVDRRATADQARWRTEIGWPVFRTDPVPP